MRRQAIDFYSGYLEDVLEAVGSRDVTLVERFLRLGDHTRRVLGLPGDLMEGWDEAIEGLLMEPQMKLKSSADAVAFASILADAGQRRFRVVMSEGDMGGLDDIFEFMGHKEMIQELLKSNLRGWTSPIERVRWGFLDVSQTERLLLDLFGDESFKAPCTAAIAGRLSHFSRQEAERRLIEVGIETQNSVSHNIDYLVIGSKGTGGTKHDKVKALQKKGHKITVLDEPGFDKLLNSPKIAPEEWDQGRKDCYESLVNALRHVWAFELDLYTIVHDYDDEITDDL